ncbi:hypothetical protein GQ43DRAFT_463241 [Delitschia confertaspora ATCC 74209]|uniref:Dynamin-binding protein n=1 Tax=Delitschia confertaspora ATCC 74209 TaxID=1513339 RepID=A0A9P4JLK9_9PLEO|nr:hypothetical protein GQ43DRAFT_463241 [Delitschia confertaspora ATCC 74209]
MGEPEKQMHNYAFPPSVANWVHTTTLATQFDGSTDELSEPEPDVFYRPAHNPQGDPETSAYTTDMTTSRLRQPTLHGPVRAAPKPSFRSASSPATTSLSTSRSTPQLPGNRPPVRSLVQRFNSPPAESSASNPQTHPLRPRQPSRTTTSPEDVPTTVSSSPATRTTPSYGPHKFPNLKQRERPQPAPASPARTRRASTASKSAQTSPSRTKVASPPRSRQSQSDVVRRPFFGEVVGDQHGGINPGYGIQSFGSSMESETANVASLADNSDIKPLARETAEEAHEGMERQPAGAPVAAVPSPRSRIPVPKRRTSTTSDSSTSTRSSKAGGPHYMSPIIRRSVGKENSPRGQRIVPGQTLQPVSYRDYRDRGKAAKGVSNGTSLTAVLTTTAPPQTSPRLRNSRERQLLPHDGRSKSRSVERLVPDKQDEQKAVDDGDPEGADNWPHGTSNFSATVDEGLHTHLEQPSAHVTTAVMNEHDPATQKQESSAGAAPQLLSLITASLREAHEQEPSSATDFEYDDSPVFGMPGGYTMAPPVQQSTTSLNTRKNERYPAPNPKTDEGELLQARTFQPQSRQREDTPNSEYFPPSATSDFSLGESIPIMLGSDTHRMGWNTSARPEMPHENSTETQVWRSEPLDSTGSISYLIEEESPIDPFANRGSLRPDDSTSVAYYHHLENHSADQTPRLSQIPDTGTLTMDSEAYSVINRVLELYHQSGVVTPAMAHDFQHRVEAVSPVIAQHQDWNSKEATTSYLARLLSDANASSPQHERNATTATDHTAAPQVPSLNVEDKDTDAEASGTAIIFPSQSGRYSGGSTVTTIWDDDNRAESTSANQSRGQISLGGLPPVTPLHSNGSSGQAPSPPPKDWQYSSSHQASYPAIDPPLSTFERLSEPFSSLLPEIEIERDGLGLSLEEADQRKQREAQHLLPPAPTYTPPLPPPLPSVERATAHAPIAPHSHGAYSTNPDSGAIPSAPSPGTDPNMCLPPVHQRRQEGYARLPDDPIDDFESATTRVPTNSTVTNVTILSRTSTSDPRGSSATVTNEPITDPARQALKRRLHVVKEILDTENAFACDMIVVDKMFRYTCDDVLNDQEEKVLFGNSAQLCDFADRFFNALKRATRPIGHYKQPLKAKTQAKSGRSRSVRTESDADTAAGSEHDDQSMEGARKHDKAHIRDDSRMSYEKAFEETFANLTVENDRKTRIGAAFMKHLPQIEAVFTPYLLNADDANEFLRSIKNNERIKGWEKACIAHAEGLTQSWDLDSLLVKPMQRVTKYPLLLKELLACTPADHPDYADIKAAEQAIREMNVRINAETDKQKTLREATKEGKKKEKGLTSLEIRLGKNFVKAFGRKGDKFKQPAGAIEVFDDPDYNYQSQRFGGHFFQLQIILRDLEKYLEKLTVYVVDTNCMMMAYVNMLEGNPASPELESQWRRSAQAFLELQNKALEEYKIDVQTHIINPLLEVWKLYVSPQQLMEERKKLLVQYTKYRAVKNKSEKVDEKLQKSADRFKAVNDALKKDLPHLYAKTKTFIGALLHSLIFKQKNWWMMCQKKIYPLLENEPEHTVSIIYDLKAYVDRFQSDFASINTQFLRLGIVNHQLLTDVSNNFMSPQHSYYSDDASSRKSTSRRTHSLGSDVSGMEPAGRRSGGMPPRQSEGSHSFEGPPRVSPTSRNFGASPASAAASRAISPTSDLSDATVRHNHSGFIPFPSFDGASDYNPAAYNGFLTPSYPSTTHSSAIFNSALPMSDSPTRIRHELPASTPETSNNEPEVLFLAASLFEFNIAHDRREGGIPYLVYVPGEIFDVIGMKGELWLARNQDDKEGTVGWIWEKHFARILPEDA